MLHTSTFIVVSAALGCVVALSTETFAARSESPHHIFPRAVAKPVDHLGLHARELQGHVLDPDKVQSDFVLRFHEHLPPSSEQGGIAGIAACPPRLCGTVFGFLPYYASAADIRWDLLTHVGCFSMEIDGNGEITNSHSWPWTNVINTAHANGVKVILVATMFNTDNLNSLLGDSTKWSTFCANMKMKMIAGSADGINIDFEGSGEWVSHMPEFLAYVTNFVHTQMPGSEVTFDGPPVDWNSEWNLPAVANACDGIFVMAYDFYGSWSVTSGPSAPLTGGFYNVKYAIETQYASVLVSSPQKLILGCPYYGNRWATTSGSAYSSVIAWEDYPPYSTLEPQSQTYGVQWDAISQTPWYAYFSGGVWRQVWFDNAQSFDLKIQYAKSKNLKGIGMWSLGQDGALPGMWNKIAANYRDPCAGYCAADIVPGCGNHLVNVDDLLAVINHWGICPPQPTLCIGDINHSQSVNVDDLLAVINSWGPCP